ncbi:hypothetical protein [Burkholderia humptydooensis]|uniref:hypothetical protein n=1 Tax=Burkholderia humptydooensis TaxID=430531 RepID=UPI0012FD0F73|nr:hypothetical protein [Burkholderia humptydooensis]
MEIDMHRKFFLEGGDRRRRLPMKEGGRLRASGRRLSTISVDKHVDILRTRAPSR